MPWKSKQQQAFGNSATGKKAIGTEKVKEFNAATKGKVLPKKAQKK